LWTFLPLGLSLIHLQVHLSSTGEAGWVHNPQVSGLKADGATSSLHFIFHPSVIQHLPAPAWQRPVVRGSSEPRKNLDPTLWMTMSVVKLGQACTCAVTNSVDGCHHAAKP
jgi:hypothetical protein